MYIRCSLVPKLEKMDVNKFNATQKSACLLEQIIRGLYSDNYKVGDRHPTKASLSQMVDANRYTSTKEYYGKRVIIYA